VQSGLAGPDTIRKVVGQAASDTFNEQRMKRKAAGDVSTLVEQFNTGAMDLRQAAGVRDSILRKYSPGVLQGIPAWRQREGTESQYRQQIQESINAKAERSGLPADAWTWNDRAGSVVPNNEWFEIEGFKTERQTKLATERAEEYDRLKEGIEREMPPRPSKGAAPEEWAEYHDSIRPFNARIRNLNRRYYGDPGLEDTDSAPVVTEKPDGVSPDLQRVVARRAAQTAGLPVVMDSNDYDTIEPGESYVDPQGRQRTKPAVSQL
jgi:hypothetical protein